LPAQRAATVLDTADAALGPIAFTATTVKL
jgi:hypothetical protein